MRLPGFGSSTDARRASRHMVRKDLAGRGISDKRVLAAMASVPRERFVPQDLQHLAYADQPLPIGCDQTISQPYIVALMTELAHVTRRSRVLEIGTGSGYQTAVLAKIVDRVWSIERIQHLSREAEKRLHALGIANATLLIGDGALGYRDSAPYDAIIVTAAAPHSPQPLLDQLAIGGHLVIPLGDRAVQVLYSVERTTSGFVDHTAGSCRFVPLVSPQAFED
ncbi:MAG: protein-L-isoaspartate(D-aspartate) O-methyltransferase [Gemmatimonadota bacterium]|nr:MAG: protein-L-isoaspartate(D-aspartate) O-methyltransferase [Gemmatimonadota bacterium]